MLVLVTCIITFFLSLVFILLASFYDHSLVFAMDHKLSLLIYNYSESIWIDRFYIFITHLASGSVITLYIFMLFLFFWIKKKKTLAFFFMINMLGINLIMFGLKSLFQRERPDLQHMVEVNSYSFPSGHAMNAIAFFGFLLYLLWHNKMKNSYWYLGLTVITVTLIGFSRVYLGVHYPFDVLAGYAVGLLWVWLMIYLYRTSIKLS